ncbi:MAG: NAD-dependent succinate-semialdehyde dehydrogenase [Geminicoccaceae bacterium]
MSENVAVDLYIGGKWQPALAGGTITLIDPATEEPVGTAAQATRADVEAAVRAAVQGFQVWRKVVPWERAKILRKTAQLVAERADAIARRLSIEVGKPLVQAKGEVQSTVDCIDWFADEARRIYGQSLGARMPDQRFQVQYEPVGPVAAFTAWNFPVVLQARKIAPALAAGCSVIARPAEEGTGAVSMLIKCFLDAGVPAGVINLLTGVPQEIAEAVMDADEVRKVTFTGSIPVGKHLMRRAADTVKRMSMELGGHSPVIVHEDVDPVKVATVSAQAKLRNAGQVCVSPNRFYVHAKHEKAFTETFVQVMSSMKLGHGLDPATEVGPLINRKRLDFIEKMVDDTVGEGARVECGGRRPAGMNRGYFYEPTVFTGVRDDMRIMNDEPFGPLAPITTFESHDEVLERANSLTYGLCSYVFTNNLKTANRYADELKTGIVCVNNFVAATAEMPFGGVKHSGFGRENGAQGIMDYLDCKFVNLAM